MLMRLEPRHRVVDGDWRDVKVNKAVPKHEQDRVFAASKKIGKGKLLYFGEILDPEPKEDRKKLSTAPVIMSCVFDHICEDEHNMAYQKSIQ